MTSHLPLAGLAVLVTRPQPSADAWAQRLRSLGAQPLVAPMMELVAVSTPEEQRAVKAIVLDFDRYQKAIFVSQNAVAHGLDWLEAYWPQLPTGIDYFAVGQSTARALEKRGIDVMALQNTGAMNSEVLLEAPELSAEAVNHQRIVIFRGQGGRGLMGQVLGERGAQVDYCELYRRQLPAQASEQLVNAVRQNPAGPLVVALHSGEALDNYTRTLGQLPQEGSELKTLRQAPLLVPSERLAEQARSLGYRRLIRADNATDNRMEAALGTAIHQTSLFSSDGTYDRDR